MTTTPYAKILSARNPDSEVLQAEISACDKPRPAHAALCATAACATALALLLATPCPLHAQASTFVPSPAPNAGAASTPAQDTAWADFRQKAAAWRALAVKPAVPAQVIQEQTLAQNAIQKNKLAVAASAYEAGLRIDPVWPDGYLKAAQIYAGLYQYDKAIADMHAYVVLVPDSPDAQSAPDQIADWTQKSKALETLVYLDPATKLMWPRQDSGGQMTQGNAVNYCGNLGMGGFSGWRLPTSTELKTIYDKSKKGGAGACKGGYLEGGRIRDPIKLTCNGGLVWESDLPYTNSITITDACFGFEKAGGKWGYTPETLKCPVLCVRRSGE